MEKLPRYVKCAEVGRGSEGEVGGTSSCAEGGCSVCAFMGVKKNRLVVKFQAGDVNGESSSSTDEVSPY